MLGRLLCSWGALAKTEFGANIAAAMHKLQHLLLILFVIEINGGTLMRNIVKKPWFGKHNSSDELLAMRDDP